MPVISLTDIQYDLPNGNRLFGPISGFDAALRSAELVALDRAHLTRTTDGMALAPPRAKGDQRGQGALVSLVVRTASRWCPVAAFERWVAASGRKTGAVFVGTRRGRVHAGGSVDRLSSRAVARAVRAAAETARLVSAELNDFSSHSLRRGLITTTLGTGAGVDDVHRHARHRALQSTLRYREVSDAVARQPRVAIGPPAESSSALDVRAVTSLHERTGRWSSPDDGVEPPRQRESGDLATRRDEPPPRSPTPGPAANDPEDPAPSGTDGAANPRIPA